ncbi:MAG: bifunctional 5,10-methylenetetrahydrofolate dehydrogenase/5,10-methenyltetrahydrofolate cyclohydrolase, partial [Candidatus Omnitrophica bacterium]|nr:bifunctional 5,10-methylenetetrahydrofolate dehydrogenase/5,10-methenyltetrahydrofolate cyclohydrolase [Candidatus Omnitrophota bacterium]
MPVKEAKLLEGKVIAAKVREGIQNFIGNLPVQGLERPRLVAIQVGGGSSAAWYVAQQEKLAEKLGIQFEKIPPENLPDQKALLGKIRELNQSPVHGVFLTMPFPKHLNADEALLQLDPKKDVEGVHPANLGLIVLRKAKLIPSTAFAVYQLIESTGIELRGKRATIVGQSPIVGRPVNLLLGECRVTTTVCNTGTSVVDLEKSISESDIVVACAGQPGLIKGRWIKPDAIVIDVGTTEVHGQLVGDVEFGEAKKRAGFITPVPGGVGPLTVTMLMQNLINAYRWQ